MSASSWWCHTSWKRNSRHRPTRPGDRPMISTALLKKSGYSTRLDNCRPVLVNAGLITAGCIVFAFGMNMVMVPNQIFGGGVTGITLLIKFRYPSTDLGLMYLLLNIPLMVLGMLSISRRFMAYSIFGMAVFSLCATLVRPAPTSITDPLLAALLSGVIGGTGAGLILRSIGSAGGFDILAIALNKHFGFRLGSIMFAINALVIMAGAWLHDLETALYSVIYMFVCSRVVDAVQTGFNTRKAMMVISEYPEAIAGDILKRDGRGVTFLDGEGAFSHQKRKIVFTITSLTDLPKLKELVLNRDPNAFIVVNDTLEVLGRRHGRMKVY